ncbi:MFS transporter [Phenylobacterium sp.]|uniref:spinster family MFS transporter n=1 Tax=Phenylobacterium sp. TaxID=1871053 RepID=UPI002C16A004|nr:MFS transporter [Phenylobacterium sp.]HVI33882.1 MFS transporter [Phenylobacterium sp.]
MSAALPLDRGAGADRRWALALMLAISTLAFVDRTILNTVGQAIKDDLGISDLQLGLLGGAAFALLYGLLALPVARLAERHSRVTIISVSVACWSIMTALCGLAGSFSQLLVARIGVGVGEAGATAPVHSLIGDYYPPRRRASAIGILGLATPLGLVVGGIGGAVLAQAHGWRMALLMVGLPGLVLAVLTRLTVKEPVRGHAEGATDTEVPPFSAVVRRLAGSRTFRHVLVAAILTNFIGASVISFMHPYFVRAFQLSYTDAAYLFALINGISVTGGYLFSGLLTDRLVKRDLRFYGWLPAACMFISAPGYLIGFAQTEVWVAVVALMLPGLFCAAWYAPTFAITQNLVTPRMRASAIALLGLSTSLIGMMLGPVATGALSDAFAARSFGPGYAGACRGGPAATGPACEAASVDGVRFALMAVVLLFFWAGTHFLLAARHARRELASGGVLVTINEVDGLQAKGV